MLRDLVTQSEQSDEGDNCDNQNPVTLFTHSTLLKSLKKLLR